MDNDNRAAPRVRLTAALHGVTLVIERPDGDGALVSTGHMYDVSMRGARIEVDDDVKLGAWVSVALDLPGERELVKVSGRVVWTTDIEDDPAAHRIAVEFEQFATALDERRLRVALGLPNAETGADTAMRRAA